MYRHPGTPTSTPSIFLWGTPPSSPLQLSESLTPRDQAWAHHFFLGPPFPKPLLPILSSPQRHPPPRPRAPIQKHRGCGPSTWGGKGDQSRCPPPRQPSLPTSALGPRPPPRRLAVQQLPLETRRLLPTSCLKAGAVWEEFGNGGRWGDGDRRERRKEVICTQSNVLARQRACQGSRTPAQGAPPNPINTPILAAPLGSLQANPSAGRLHPRPHGPTHCVQNHCLVCPSSWKTRLLLGKWASVFKAVWRCALAVRATVRAKNCSLRTHTETQTWCLELSPPLGGRRRGLGPPPEKTDQGSITRDPCQWSFPAVLPSYSPEWHSETAIHRGVAHCESAVLPESLWPAMPLHIFSCPHTRTLSRLSGQPLPPSPTQPLPVCPPIRAPTRSPPPRPAVHVHVPAFPHAGTLYPPPILQGLTASVSISLCWEKSRRRQAGRYWLKE